MPRDRAAPRFPPPAHRRSVFWGTAPVDGPWKTLPAPGVESVIGAGATGPTRRRERHPSATKHRPNQRGWLAPRFSTARPPALLCFRGTAPVDGPWKTLPALGRVGDWGGSHWGRPGVATGIPPQWNIALIKIATGPRRVFHRPPTGALVFSGDRARGRPVENASCSCWGRWPGQEPGWGRPSVANGTPSPRNIALIIAETRLRRASPPRREHRPFQDPAALPGSSARSAAGAPIEMGDVLLGGGVGAFGYRGPLTVYTYSNPG